MPRAARAPTTDRASGATGGSDDQSRAGPPTRGGARRSELVVPLSFALRSNPASSRIQDYRPLWGSCGSIGRNGRTFWRRVDDWRDGLEPAEVRVHGKRVLAQA